MNVRYREKLPLIISDIANEIGRRPRDMAEFQIYELDQDRSEADPEARAHKGVLRTQVTLRINLGCIHTLSLLHLGSPQVKENLTYLWSNARVALHPPFQEQELFSYPQMPILKIALWPGFLHDLFGISTNY